ncbi:MAG: hypothetical protein JW804_00125 [Sedimentisphaerales bacterium]|nr:hypothetical protein [Sedimentisphaerales bacterium]
MKRLGTKVSILTLLFVFIFGFNAFCLEPAEAPDKDMWADEIWWDLDNPDHPPMSGDWVKRLLDKIEEKDPEAAQKLGQLHEKDPEAFRGELHKYLMEHGKEIFGQRGGRGRPDGEGPGGGRRGQRMQEMQQKHEEFIEWLKENYPDDANELSVIKEKNPELYMHHLMRKAHKYGPIMKVSKENPELAEVMKENEDLKDQRDEILKNIQTAKPQEQEALKNQLTEIVNKRFDLIIKRKLIQHDRLLKKLESLKKNIENSEGEVEKWKATKQDRVAERVKELLEKTEKFHWD